MTYDSSDVAKASISMAISTRTSEEALIKELKRKYSCSSSGYRRDFNTSIPKIIERAVVAAKRSGIIKNVMSTKEL